MNYKIAIIGAQCTGKSTLAKALSEKLGLPMITEVARKFDKSLFYNRTAKEFIVLQKEIMKWQLHEESRYDSFVSDRSTLDNLSYWIHNCSDTASDEENIEYINTALKNVSTYTHLFLLVPEFYPIDDGFRDTNIVYQLQIAETIHAILHLYGIKPYVLKGTVENRIQKAVEILEK